MFFIYFSSLFLCVFSQEYRVTNYGGVGDGKTDDTKAVRATLAAAANTNGGRVIFDSGFTFLTGCFNVTSNIIFDVRGTILLVNTSDGFVWPGVNSTTGWENFFQATNATNLTISGGGTVDGQGAVWWECANKKNPPCSDKHRPRMLMFKNTDGITIYNITLKNAPMEFIQFDYCSNVHVYNITILAPSSHDKPPSHNTDGIDVINTINVVIENSYMSTGDDAVAITSDDPTLGGRTSQNILVRNMNIGTSHGISIGSGTAGGVQNVTVHDIYMNGSDAGPRIKSLKGRGGLVTNITYYNMHLYNMDYCIYLTYKYSGSSGDIKSDLPDYRNIDIHDITCETQHGWYLEGFNDTLQIYANFSNINISLIKKDEHEKGSIIEMCEFIYGPCDNSTVLPYCPPCMTRTLCVDSSGDCANYANQCTNPAYRALLCDKCRKTCNLCNLC